VQLSQTVRNRDGTVRVLAFAPKAAGDLDLAQPERSFGDLRLGRDGGDGAGGGPAVPIGGVGIAGSGVRECLELVSFLYRVSARPRSRAAAGNSGICF
jgi:hypothetical protein